MHLTLLFKFPAKGKRVCVCVCARVLVFQGLAGKEGGEFVACIDLSPSCPNHQLCHFQSVRAAVLFSPSWCVRVCKMSLQISRQHKIIAAFTKPTGQTHFTCAHAGWVCLCARYCWVGHYWSHFKLRTADHWAVWHSCSISLYGRRRRRRRWNLLCELPMVRIKAWCELSFRCGLVATAAGACCIPWQHSQQCAWNKKLFASGIVGREPLVFLYIVTLDALVLPALPPCPPVYN